MLISSKELQFDDDGICAVPCSRASMMLIQAKSDNDVDVGVFARFKDDFDSAYISGVNLYDFTRADSAADSSVYAFPVAGIPVVYVERSGDEVVYMTLCDTPFALPVVSSGGEE